MGTDYIEESGTSSEHRRPRHNGYYAGSFSGVSFPSVPELAQVARDLQRLVGDDATSWSHR